MVRRYIWPGFARHVLRSNPPRTSSGETRPARSGTRPTRASRLERTLRRGRCVFDDARTVSRAASSQWSGHARSRGTCGSARPHSPGAPRTRCRGGRSPSRAPQLPKGKVDRVGRVKLVGGTDDGFLFPTLIARRTRTCSPQATGGRGRIMAALRYAALAAASGASALRGGACPVASTKKWIVDVVVGLSLIHI